MSQRPSKLQSAAPSLPPRVATGFSFAPQGLVGETSFALPILQGIRVWYGVELGLKSSWDHRCLRLHSPG